MTDNSRSTRRKTCSGASRYPKNSTFTGLGLNTRFRANRPVIGLFGLHDYEDEAEGTTVLHNARELFTSTIRYSRSAMTFQDLTRKVISNKEFC
jgi:hypothetical protein